MQLAHQKMPPETLAAMMRCEMPESEEQLLREFRQAHGGQFDAED